MLFWRHKSNSHSKRHPPISAAGRWQRRRWPATRCTTTRQHVPLGRWLLMVMVLPSNMKRWRQWESAGCCEIYDLSHHKMINSIQNCLFIESGICGLTYNFLPFHVFVLCAATICLQFVLSDFDYKFFIGPQFSCLPAWRRLKVFSFPDILLCKLLPTMLHVTLDIQHRTTDWLSENVYESLIKVLRFLRNINLKKVEANINK